MTAFKVKKILVPTDFSANSNRVLNQAITIAKASGAGIKLIHVVTPIVASESGSYDKSEERFHNAVGRKAGNLLKKLVAEKTKVSKISISYEVKIGSVYKTVCDTAKKDKIDLIVMGTHGTSGFKEFFAGSNAYKVVSHAACPVLTIQKAISENGFKNIVLPIRLDRSSRQKVDYAVEMAKLFGSTIHITGFTNDKNASKQQRVKQYVAQVEKYLMKQGIKYKSKSIFADNFTKEVLKHASKMKADLIMIMKDNDFSVDQLIKGPYAQQFVNHSSTPVFCVPVISNPDLIDYDSSMDGDLY